MQMRMAVYSGPGESYASIRVIRIAVTGTANDQSSHAPAMLLEGGPLVAQAYSRSETRRASRTALSWRPTLDAVRTFTTHTRPPAQGNQRSP
jgi:hypothetical protein